MSESEKKPKPRETSTIRPYLSLELRDKLIDRFPHLAGLSDRAIFESCATFYLAFCPVQPIAIVPQSNIPSTPTQPTVKQQEIASYDSATDTIDDDADFINGDDD